MRPQNRLTILTAATALMLLILGTSGAWYVLRLQQANSQILDFNVSSIRAAEELEILVRETRYEVGRFLLTQDRNHLVAASEKETELQRWLEQATQLAVTQREQQLIQQVQSGLDKFFTRLRELLARADERVTPESVESLAADVLTGSVLGYTRQYLDLNEQELKNSSERNKAMAERLALALVLLGTCGAIAGLVAGYGITRGITRSFFQLSVPIRDVAGKLSEVVGPVEVSADPSIGDLQAILQSVSDQVGAVVAQLHARHREVIRADQLAAVGQLAAGLAHEIRNPLMCMKTLVQAAKRRGEAAAKLDSRDLAVLDEEITRLERLLQSFFDFARPANLEKQQVDLADLVRQTVDLVSAKAELRAVAVVRQLPPQPLVVQADAVQLRQVLLNLLLNALDAVPNGGKIWITGEHEERSPAAPASNGQNKPSVRLRVADNGQGLPDANRGRIFEPFFSTKDVGLGLGLAVSQRIVEAHGGQLVARDREGGGAVFEITLAAERLSGSPVT